MPGRSDERSELGSARLGNKMMKPGDCVTLVEPELWYPNIGPLRTHKKFPVGFVIAVVPNLLLGNGERRDCAVVLYDEMIHVHLMKDWKPAWVSTRMHV